MSVIAAFIVNDMPVIVGDVLFSTDGDHGLSISLPGSGQNTHEFAEQNPIKFYPVKLGQKVAVINKHLTIATAGSLNVAVEFIKHLKSDQLFNTKPTQESLKKAIESFEHPDEDNFAFVFHYYNKEEKTWMLDGYNYQSIEVEGYGKILIAGSGTELFIDTLQGVEFKFEDKNLPERIQSRFRMVNLLTNLWAYDITNQETILNAIGGGYEIGVRGVTKEDELGKADDFLFTQLFIHSPNAKEALIGMNTRFVKVDYVDENLFIRVVHLKPDQKTPFKDYKNKLYIPSSDNRMYIVLPLDHTGEEDFSSQISRLPDMKAKYCGVQVNIVAPNGKSLTSTFVEWSPTRDIPIQITKNEINYAPKFWQKILNTAHEFIQDNS